MVHTVGKSYSPPPPALFPVSLSRVFLVLRVNEQRRAERESRPLMLSSPPPSPGLQLMMGCREESSQEARCPLSSDPKVCFLLVVDGVTFPPVLGELGGGPGQKVRQA